ncbi:hypothetical protein Micbo1qcDRAFT_230509 [Microdochium bolleyi]|uniref:Nudix hydrolase domain-containing protein n=1 Tax=Microdochium bolleyi TaxID=196109 RepID=A0A136JDH7_9PEZI|nr:hypothetical protein Micbo1qcDRAFT_230509 [Microdochium bolleyi]
MLLSWRTSSRSAPKLRTRSTAFSRTQLPDTCYLSHHQRRVSPNLQISRGPTQGCPLKQTRPVSTTSTRTCRIRDNDPVNIYAAGLRASLTAGKMAMSNLDLMMVADAFPYQDKPSESADYDRIMSTLYTLLWTTSPQSQHSPPEPPVTIGYLRDHVVDALLAVPESIRGPVAVDRQARTVRAFEHLPSEPERTRAVGDVMAYWREHNTFEVLRGWRDELWPVYGSETEVLYSVERSGAGLLGVLRHGVHMMAYTMPSSSSSSTGTAGGDTTSRRENTKNDMRIWISRRSPTKQTYPGMLDNTVAGGFMTGEIPFECMVREADEEASLPEQLMRERARERGIVTYIHITDERAGGEAGQIYPEMQWIYDIELPDGVVPVPKDGEVAGFELMTVQAVQAELSKGSFKPNCALVLLEFFVRHGILTRENEPGFDEIVARMHRSLPLPGPHLGYRS